MIVYYNVNIMWFMFDLYPFSAEAKPVVPPAQTKLEAPGSGEQAGGLAVPPENGEGDGSVHEEETPEKEPEQEEVTKPTKKWMDFDQFCRCFKWVLYHIIFM